MDKKHLTLLFVQPLITAVAVIIGLLIFNTVSSSPLIGGKDTRKTFEVEGTGKVSVTPDTYSTTFSIIENGSTQKEAQEKGNIKQKEAVEALLKLGLDRKDIQTSGYNVNPEYDYSPNGNNKITGYTIYINNTIKSKDIDVINNAVDALTNIGININGVMYTFEDEEKYKEEARNKAIEQAKRKAESLAKAGEFRLGGIASIKEVDSPYGYPVPMLLEKDAAMGRAGNVATQIEPGSNDVTSRVQITYYIK